MDLESPYDKMMKNKMKKNFSIIEGEEWKQIQDLPYYVSNFGRIKGKYGIMKPQLSPSGYYTILLYDKKHHKKLLRQVHRLELETFQPVANMQFLYVNHKDLNKANNQLNNLEWVSAKQNAQHYFKTAQPTNYNSIKCKDNYGNIFNSYNEAARFHKISANAVKYNVLGKTKISKKNLIFSKIED